MAGKIWISVKEYAEHVDFSDRYIRRLIKQGKIPNTATRTKDRKTQVHVKKADLAISENISQDHRARTKGIKTGPGLKKDDPRNSLDTAKVVKSSSKKSKKDITPEEKMDVVEGAGLTLVTLAEAQRIESNYKAAIKKLDYENKNKLSLDAKDVEKIWSNAVSAARTKILSLKGKIAPLVKEFVSDQKNFNIIMSEVESVSYEVLEDLSHGGE